MYSTNIFFNDVCENLEKSGINCTFNIKKKLSDPEKYKDSLFLNISFFIHEKYANLSKSSKKFNSYLNGLNKNIISYGNKIDFVIRLYIDKSILNSNDTYLKNTIKKIEELNNSEIIICTFKDFFKNDKHMGFFFTLTRILALFDFKNHNKYNMVLDADYTYPKEYVFKVHKLLKHNDYILHIIDCFISIERLANIDNSSDVRILANMLSSVHLDKKIFIDFLKNLRDKKNIEDWVTYTKDEIYNYGIDEYFINKYLLKHILKYKRNLYKISYWGIAGVNYSIYKNIENKKLFNNNQIKKMIIEINKAMKLETSQDIHKNLKKLDEFLYTVRDAINQEMPNNLKKFDIYYKILFKYKNELSTLGLIDKQSENCIKNCATLGYQFNKSINQ
jgi:hypothetical protein